MKILIVFLIFLSLSCNGNQSPKTEAKQNLNPRLRPVAVGPGVEDLGLQYSLYLYEDGPAEIVVVGATDNKFPLDPEHYYHYSVYVTELNVIGDNTVQFLDQKVDVPGLNKNFENCDGPSNCRHVATLLENKEINLQFFVKGSLFYEFRFKLRDPVLFDIENGNPE